MSKRCGKCQRDLPLSDYPTKKNRGRVIPLRLCRECERERAREVQRRRRQGAKGDRFRTLVVQMGKRAAVEYLDLTEARKAERIRRAAERIRLTEERARQPKRIPLTAEQYRERWREYQARRRRLDPASPARRAVQRAVERGALVKPSRCQRCSTWTAQSLLHGHHHNGYDAAHWLDVEWLCPRCHVVAEGSWGKQRAS